MIMSQITNRRKITLKITRILLVMLLFAYPLSVLAEKSRSIYIGDIINLEVSNTTKEDIREAFRSFEIVDIKDVSGGFLVSLRTFDIGEHKIILGNTEIIITVQSTLDDIQNEDIFEGDTDVIESGIIFDWRTSFLVALGVFVLSGVIVLFKSLPKRKHRELTPHELFLKRSATLSLDDENYFVDLTFYFKEYIGAVSGNIVGKTTAEIVSHLATAQPPFALNEIEEWLEECDRLKFTGVTVSQEAKQNHCDRLVEIVEKINNEQSIHSPTVPNVTKIDEVQA